MKLKDIIENSVAKVVPDHGVAASRTTPVAAIATDPPLPDDLCDGRYYCERKKKKDKKKKKMEKKLSEMTGFLSSSKSDNEMSPYFEYVKEKGIHFGIQDGYDIVYAVGNNKNDHFYGLKNENNDVITVTLLVDHPSIDGKKTKEFRFIHTLTDSRKDNMGKRLVFFIKNQENLSLIDYGYQSKLGIDFLKSMGDTGKYTMFWYNIKTNEKQPYDHKIDNKDNAPFRAPISTDWRILIEGDESYSRMERYYLPSMFPGAPNDLRYKHYHSLF